MPALRIIPLILGGLLVTTSLSGQPPPVLARLGGNDRLCHAQGISAIAYTPDGKLLASAGYDGTVRLWDPTTGKEVRRFVGHTGGVLSLAVSPDGKLLASGGADQTIRLWDSGTGKERFTLTGHKGYVSSLAFSPDGKQLASTSADMKAKVWDPATGKELLHIDAHDDYAGPVAFSPDGKLLATASAGILAVNQQPKNPDYSIRFWDPQTGKRLQTLQGHKRGIRRLVFRPDGKQLASTSASEGTIRIWEVASGKEVRAITAPPRPARNEIIGPIVNDFFCLAFSPDGKVLAAGSNQRTLKLWDTDTGKELPSLQAEGQGDYPQCLGVAFSPDGTTVATVLGRTIAIWDRTTGKERFAPPPVAPAIRSVAVSPDGRSVGVGSADGSVRVWDVGTGREVAKRAGQLRDPGWTTFSPDGAKLAIGTADGVALWDPATNTDIASLEAGGRDTVAQGFAFSPDGKTLAVIYRETLLLWDVAGGKERARASLAKHYQRAVAFSPDSRLIATSTAEVPSYDARILIWDGTNARQLARIEVERIGTMWSYLAGLAFSVDGRMIDAVSRDRAIRRWELATGKEAQRIANPAGQPPFFEVRGAAFAPKQGLLALGIERDQSVRLWDLGAGKEVQQFQGGEGVPYAVGFGPDGKTLAAGYLGGVTLVWDAKRFTASVRLPRGKDPAKLEPLWADLAGEDAVEAQRAVVALAGGGAPTVEFLTARLKDARQPAVPDAIRKLAIRLAHEFPAVREAAAQELKEYSGALDPLMQKLLDEKPPAEVRAAVEAHMASKDRGLRVPAGPLLQAIRAVQALEANGSKESRAALESLAKGPAASLTTQEARAALARVSGQP